MARPQLKLIDGTQPEDRTVKPELNLEQWPLFIPSQARGRNQQTRTITRIVETLPNGDTRTESVTVGYCEHGTLTAKDQRVLYALVQNWNEKGCPLSFCYFSVHRLLQLLKLQDGGTNIKAIIDSLDRLQGVAITFKSCFYDAENQKEVEDKEPIHILSELKIRTRKKIGKEKRGKYETTKAEGYFLFHSRILKNLIRNYTRPVLFDVVLSLKSDTAQLLYALVDRQLATKESYTKATAALFQEIGLEGKDYHKPSARKRAIEKPLSELLGKRLSSGGIIGVASLEATKDNTDYKVIFRKRATLQVLPPAKREEQSDPETLVMYFHQIFFGVENVKPGKKEIEQARQLISVHGLDTAKAVIDCAKREAPKTNFDIQTFGGVMQYQGKALAMVEAAKKREAERAGREESLAAQRLEQLAEWASSAYFDLFADAYFDFFFAEVEGIKTNHADEWKRYEAETKAETTKVMKFCSDVTSNAWRQVFAGYVRRHFSEGHALHIADFWQWDEENNSERFDPTTEDGMQQLGLGK